MCGINGDTGTWSVIEPVVDSDELTLAFHLLHKEVLSHHSRHQSCFVGSTIVEGMQTLFQGRDVDIEVDDTTIWHRSTLSFVEGVINPVLVSGQGIVAIHLLYLHEVLHHHGAHNTILIDDTHGDRM